MLTLTIFKHRLEGTSQEFQKLIFDKLSFVKSYYGQNFYIALNQILTFDHNVRPTAVKVLKRMESHILVGKGKTSIVITEKMKTNKDITSKGILVIYDNEERKFTKRAARH